MAVLPHYAAAEAALVNSTVSLAWEFSNTGSRKSRFARTDPDAGAEMHDAWHRQTVAKGTDDREEIERPAVKEIVPNSVGTIGRFEEIAHPVKFLASPLADYIDGADLRVDGRYVTSINH